MKRFTMCAIAILAGGLLLASSGFAAAAAPPARERLVLDAYFPWSNGYTPPISSSFRLPKGKYWVAVVSGTFSFYPAALYKKSAPGEVCGKPDPSAEYRGSLGGNGPTGYDAEWIFAQASQARCKAGHFPESWSNFQMNSGRGWSHPNLLGPVENGPTPNHTYSFAIVGHGARIQARLRDAFTRDNYGLLHLLLRPARPSDCASYQAFGFSTQTGCVSVVSR